MLIKTLFPKTKKFLLVSALIFTAGVAGGAMLLYLVYSEQQLFKENYAKASGASLREQMLVTNSTLLRSSKEEQALVADAFITERGVVPFLEEMEARADSMEIKFDIMSVTLENVTDPSKEEEEEDEKENEQIRVQFSAEGSWDRVVHFLSITESLPYLVALRTVRLDSVASTGMWRLTATIFVAKSL